MCHIFKLILITHNTITNLPLPYTHIPYYKPKIMYKLVFRFDSHLLSPGVMHVLLHHQVGEHLLHLAQAVTELWVSAALVTI